MCVCHPMKYSRENKEKGGSKGGLHGGSLAVECSIVWILLIGKVFFSLGSVLEDGKLVQIWMLVVVFFSIPENVWWGQWLVVVSVVPVGAVKYSASRIHQVYGMQHSHRSCFVLV